MTEDETFDVLRRVPFEELLQMWCKSTKLSSTESVKREFIESHIGWTYTEFLDNYGRLMTEDETFNALKKIPFNEMSNIYFEWVGKGGRRDGLHSREELFKLYGWTYDVWSKKRYRG